MIDTYPDSFVAVEMHTQFDGFETPWGEDRLQNFYGAWAGTAIPLIMYDGFWYPLSIGDYERDMLDQMDNPTDVTIEVTGTEIGAAEYAFTAEVCVEPSGVGKTMRIYTVQALDFFPFDPDYSRNTVRQAALTRDITLNPGECDQVDSTFEFDSESWINRQNIKIVVWAQEALDVGPANVFQAEQIGWPFPEGGGTVDPEFPRGFALPVPLFVDDFSAWNRHVSTVPVVDDNDEQVQTTYQVLCGDTSGMFPVDDPPTTDWPYPQVAYDDGSIPIFGAAGSSQETIVCDYRSTPRLPNPKWGVETEGGPIQPPACIGIVRPSGPEGLDSDGFLVMYDPVTRSEYDFWQASTQVQAECVSEGGGLAGSRILETGQADIFDVKGRGSNVPGVWGARAAATPLLAGLILPEDVASGIITHALAVAVPGLRNTSSNPELPVTSDIVFPASFTQTERYNTTPASLAAGQRLRLKQNLQQANGQAVNENELAPITRMVFAALRGYGAYVVDSTNGLYFFAEDFHTAVLQLDDDQINQLIGEPNGTPLPAGKTRWQVVMEALNEDLALVPFAVGPCDGVSSTVETANFEVIESASPPPAELPAPRRPSGRWRASQP
jgi:hypothetical protein